MRAAASLEVLYHTSRRDTMAPDRPSAARAPTRRSCICALHLIQMMVTADRGRSPDCCGRIREAAQNGADFAVLPEMFCCPYDNSCFAAYGEPEGGEVQTTLSALAAKLGI